MSTIPNDAPPKLLMKVSLLAVIATFGCVAAQGSPQNLPQASSTPSGPSSVMIELAERGNPGIQALLGDFYNEGRGGAPQDYTLAAKWYRKAADQGDAYGQVSLGQLYEQGHGVPQDYTEAMKWFHKAADQGSSHGQRALGSLYSEGHGMPQDYGEAMKWYRRSADQGDEHGQFLVGTLYEEGRGVPQDYTEAAKWYRKAADQGAQVGQYFLGEMYAFGHGVPQDYVQAHLWFNLAAAGPSGTAQQLAAKNRDISSAKMTREQIAEAQRLAREWKPTPAK